MVDYLRLLNRRDGGINGVKLVWEECETAFDDRRGVACFEQLKDRGAQGAAVVMPLSGGISYALTERAREQRIPMLMLGYGRADAADGRAFPYAFPLVTHLLSQAAAQIRFIGASEGGMERLRGKTIVNLYLDLPTGREAMPLLDVLAAQHGFELIHIGLPLPGVEQAAAWARIRRVAGRLGAARRAGPDDAGRAAGGRGGGLSGAAHHRLRPVRRRAGRAARRPGRGRLHRAGAQPVGAQLRGHPRHRQACARRPAARPMSAARTTTAA